MRRGGVRRGRISMCWLRYPWRRAQCVDSMAIRTVIFKMINKWWIIGLLVSVRHIHAPNPHLRHDSSTLPMCPPLCSSMHCFFLFEPSAVVPSAALIRPIHRFAGHVLWNIHIICCRSDWIADAKYLMPSNYLLFRAKWCRKQTSSNTYQVYVRPSDALSDLCRTFRPHAVAFHHLFDHRFLPLLFRIAVTKYCHMYQTHPSLNGAPFEPPISNYLIITLFKSVLHHGWYLASISDSHINSLSLPCLRLRTKAALSSRILSITWRLPAMPIWYLLCETRLPLMYEVPIWNIL